MVDDVSQPAFMQPPIPEGSLEEAGYSSQKYTPDELDMLVTSKNHDLKGNRILNAAPEHWLYSLLTLQTLEGYSGRYHGISRMNGGGGNRPLVGLAPNLSWSGRFLRDLKVLIGYRDELYEMYDKEGLSLLWTVPWNGEKEDSIYLSNCDPYFIEICRRIRFQIKNDEIICVSTITKTKRIDVPDELNGVTKDPWTPIKKDGIKAYSVTKKGFTYQVIQQLLLGEDFIRPKTLEFKDGERNGTYMVNRALVRGGGVKTETFGLHNRVIKISAKVSGIFLNDKTVKEKLAKRSSERVALASEVQKKILYPSISSLLSSGSGERTDYEKVAPWINRFDQEIDRRFFESLWASVDMEPEEAKRRWEGILLEEAEKIFKEAERSTPIAQLRRLRALSKAQSMFYGQARKVFEYAGEQESFTQ